MREIYEVKFEYIVHIPAKRGMTFDNVREKAMQRFIDRGEYDSSEIWITKSTEDE